MQKDDRAAQFLSLFGLPDLPGRLSLLYNNPAVPFALIPPAGGKPVPYEWAWTSTVLEESDLGAAADITLAVKGPGGARRIIFPVGASNQSLPVGWDSWVIVSRSLTLDGFYTSNPKMSQELLFYPRGPFLFMNVFFPEWSFDSAAYENLLMDTDQGLTTRSSRELLRELPEAEFIAALALLKIAPGEDRIPLFLECLEQYKDTSLAGEWIRKVTQTRQGGVNAEKSPFSLTLGMKENPLMGSGATLVAVIRNASPIPQKIIAEARVQPVRLILTDAAGREVPSTDRRAIEHVIIVDFEKMIATLAPGGEIFPARMNRRTVDGYWELEWGTWRFDHVPPGAYTAKIVWESTIRSYSDKGGKEIPITDIWLGHLESESIQAVFP